MIRWMRTARMTNTTNMMTIVTWAKEMAKYTSKYEGAPPIAVCVDAIGDYGTLRWFADYENLAAFEKLNQQVINDPEYWEKLSEAKGFFIAGKTKDVVMNIF